MVVPVVGVRAVGEAHGQHVAIAVRRHLLAAEPEPVRPGATHVGHPHDVVDLARHQAAGGGGDVQVGTVPHDAAGVHAQRSEHEHPVLVEHRHHQQHVPVAQAGQVDEGDPDAALVLGVPAHGQHVLAADVLGVGGVGRGGDALRPPARVAAVLPVEGEAPVDGAAEPPAAEQEGAPGLAVEVGQHPVDADRAAEQGVEGGDLADVLVGPAQVHAERAARPSRAQPSVVPVQPAQRSSSAPRSCATDGSSPAAVRRRRRPRAGGSSRAARSSRGRRPRRRWCARYERSSASGSRSRTGSPREAPIAAGLVLRVARRDARRRRPAPVEHDAVRWLAADELEDVDWLDPDRPFLPEIASRIALVEVGRQARRETPWVNTSDPIRSVRCRCEAWPPGLEPRNQLGVGGADLGSNP